MQYVAVFTREGSRTTIEFPDCPGCVSFAEADEDARAIAADALEGWLEANLVDEETPPRPLATRRRRSSDSGDRVAIALSAPLAALLEIRWAREAMGLSKSDLAARLGMTRQQYARIESPESNVTLATLQRIGQALGGRWDVQLSVAEKPPARYEYDKVGPAGAKKRERRRSR